MTTPQELTNEIRNDVKGQFEQALEKKAMEALNRLKKEGKISQDEVVKLYRTNFKKLLQVDVKTTDVLVQKSSQIDNVTKKLLALQLSKSKESDGFMDKVKGVIYRTADIERDITKNSATKNIIKGVIDEVMSLPEMLIEAVKHPIDFAKGLTALFKGETWKKLWDEISNVGLATPAQQYQTGRSGMMAVLMIFPGGIGKTLLNIGKKLGKVVKLGGKTLKSIGKEGFKETGKKVVNTITKEAKNTVGKTKEGVKNITSKTQKTVQQFFEKPQAKINNIKAKNTIKQVSKDIEKIGDDIMKKQKELSNAQGYLKIKNIKPERIKELNDQITKLQKEIPDLVKKQKELNKTLKSAKKEVATTNTKLGIDNNKVAVKKRYENNTKKVGDDIMKKQKELSNAQGYLKVKNIKPERIKELNDQITKLQKEIPDLMKKQKDLLTKAKNYDVRRLKTPREGIRKTLTENLKNIKGVSIEKLNALRYSPHRLSIVKDLFSLRKANSKIKELIRDNQSIKAVLDKPRKNGKTALENAKINPKFGNAKSILAKERILNSQLKGLEGMKKIQNNIKQKMYNQLTGLGVIALANIKDLDDKSIYNISEYLFEDNDPVIAESFEKTNLERGSTNIGNIDTGVLDKLSIEELKTTKLVITGLASKTGTKEINERLARQRAENTREIIMKSYPGLQTGNISINISLQPQDSDGDVSLWQGAKINTSTENLAYVKGYQPQKVEETA